MAGAGTLGIHLRWLPRARIEIPFRDCRRATASRSANPATINVPSRLETNLTTAWHECRHLGTEPGASEPGSRRQSITPPPQARGGSNGTSRCRHCQTAPLSAWKRDLTPYRRSRGPPLSYKTTARWLGRCCKPGTIARLAGGQGRPFAYRRSRDSPHAGWLVGVSPVPSRWRFRRLLRWGPPVHGNPMARQVAAGGWCLAGVLELNC